MNLQQIIYVVEIYKQRSFSSASKVLYISQPRLSQAIRDLEKELGFELFERNRKGISNTTVKGYQFIMQAQKALKQFNCLEDFKEASSLSFHLSTTLISQAQNAFVRLCNENCQLHDLNFDMWFSGCYETTDRVRNLVSDLGIVTIINTQLDDWLSYFNTSKLEYTELICTECQISVSIASPLAKKEKIAPDDLQGYTYISEKCSRMNNLTMQVYSLFDSFCPNTKITVSNTDIMYQLVSDNKAFSLDCIPLDEKTRSRYGLVSVPLDDPLRVHTGYLHHTQVPMKKLTLEYLDLLKQELDL